MLYYNCKYWVLETKERAKNMMDGNMCVYLTQEIVDEIWEILSKDGKERYSLTIWSNYPGKLMRRLFLLSSIHQHELQDGLVLLVAGDQVNLYSQKQICLPEDSSGLFSQNYLEGYPFSLNTMQFNGVNTSEVTNMSQMFMNCNVSELCLGKFDTSNVTDMSYMFLGCEAKCLDLSGFDTGNVTNMEGMFAECQATSLDLSSFDTGNVTNMCSMFSSCEADIIGLGHFDTSKVTNMSWMFNAYRNMIADLDLGSWDTSSVTNMNAMFKLCQITSLDLENWNTSHVEDMSYMFQECSVRELDIHGFDLSALKHAGNIFCGCDMEKIILSAKGHEKLKRRRCKVEKIYG